MMKTLLFFALVVALISPTIAEVTVLTPDNFDSIVGAPAATFVKFFAPWCGHCKNMAPAWVDLANKFGSHANSIRIAEVDCDQHNELCGRYGVTGFPTLKFFPKGSHGDKELVEDYNGGRGFDELANFVSEKSGVRLAVTPSNVVTADDDNFADVVVKSNKGVFVEFYAPWCGHCKNLAPTWEKLGDVFQNEPTVEIVKINADQHRISTAPYGIQGFPTLIWFPADNKENYERFEFGHDLLSLVAFVNEKAGTHRSEDGSLDEEAGRVEALDLLAAEFVASADRDSLRQKVAATSVDAWTQKVYLSVMDKIAKNGVEFLASETARIGKILASGSVNALKADEFKKRLNIIAAFSS